MKLQIWSSKVVSAANRLKSRGAILVVLAANAAAVLKKIVVQDKQRVKIVAMTTASAMMLREGAATLVALATRKNQSASIAMKYTVGPGKLLYYAGAATNKLS